MRRRYLVEGDVQGVGFRYFTVRLGQQVGIRGWVRNLPDGRVEAVGEGNAEQLDRFETSLRRGPPMAAVTEVQVSELRETLEELTGFQIRWP